MRNRGCLNRFVASWKHVLFETPLSETASSKSPRGGGGGAGLYSPPSRHSPSSYESSFSSSLASSPSSTSSTSFNSSDLKFFLCRLPAQCYRLRFAIFGLLVVAWMLVFFTSFTISNSTSDGAKSGRGLSYYFGTGSSNQNAQLKSAIGQLKELAKSQKEVEEELDEIRRLLQVAAERRGGKVGEVVTFKKPSLKEDDSQNDNFQPLKKSPSFLKSSAEVKSDINKNDNCTFVAMDPRFPHCADKVKWMESFWHSDSCYASFGVDGTRCSFHIFLSEIETFCPRLPWRAKPAASSKTALPEKLVSNSEIAPVDEILAKLKEDRVSFIKSRIERQWPMWRSAWEELIGPGAQQNTTSNYAHRRRRTIIVHLGFLTPEMERRWHMAETASKGGPLGEMVQWSDVIAAIHALGHEIVLTYDKPTLQSVLSERTHLSATSCQANTVKVDLIYTDIVGYKQALSVLSQSGIKCRVRLLDSFGTEPAYNHELYSKRFALPGQWGRLNMNPKQFYTLFPHSPDNSFMGFVVTMPPPSDNKTVRLGNASLIYGKHITMWQGAEREAFIETLAELTQVHGTVDEGAVQVKPGDPPIKELPSFVINHGVLKPDKFRDLLWSSRIFVGLGFPYEGPAPLEAIAAGCVFLNPAFKPPHTSLNTVFFKGKPTSRGLTSQSPYAEKVIGKPRVITVDITDLKAVRAAVKEALSTEPSPFIPREFTAVGMLERLNAYIENQDLCSGEKPLWPPESSVEFVVGEPGLSCTETCERKSLICEPTHFYRANTLEQMQRLSGGVCHAKNIQSSQDIVNPVIGEGGTECSLQDDMMLFSCAGAAESSKRICPCRDIMPGQTALCRNCL